MHNEHIQHILPYADPALRQRDMVQLHEKALRRHLLVVGSMGAGKTSATVDGILWPLFCQGHPAIVMCPVNTLARRMIHHIACLPRYLQPYLFNRLVYVARGATDYVMRTPIYEAKDAHESHYHMANRFVQVIARSDPFLATASIEGMNAATEAGIYSGQLASEMNLQMTEVADFLRRPELWESRMAQAAHGKPLLQEAVSYFQQLKALKEKSPAMQARKTGSFLTKILPFLADPVMQAPYAASGPGLQIDAHVSRRDMILYDYSYITDRDAKQFAMLWDFLEIAEYVKRRGPAGYDQPFLWCIDEVSALTNLHANEHSILGDDIKELATQFARNNGAQMLCMLQSVSQLPPLLLKALTQFDTKLVGKLPDREDALHMAGHLYQYDPHWVRKRETVWVNDPVPEYHQTGPMSISIFARANYVPIDERTTEYTIDEQYELGAQTLQNLPVFHFLLKAAPGEGDRTGRVRKVSFEKLVNGNFPDNDLIEEALPRLRKKWGEPVKRLLKEIARRKQQALTVRNASSSRNGKTSNSSRKRKEKRDKMKQQSTNNAYHDADNGHLSAADKRAGASQTEAWQDAFFEPLEEDHAAEP